MISLVLQCYPGDLAAAFDLAKLICDIEPGRVENGEFYLIYRRDCDERTPKYWTELVGRKFERGSARPGRNFEVGHPGGSNMLAACAFMEVSILRREGLFQNSGFLLFEADCVPLQRDWLRMLSAEWDQAYAGGKLCMGHWHQQGDRSTLHQNGNGVFSAEMFDRRGFSGLIGPGTQGWDYWHRDFFIAVGCDTNLIYQWYNCPSISAENLAGIRKNGAVPALFHGVKDDSARRHARAMLCAS